jgi:hypothetical protein
MRKKLARPSQVIVALPSVRRYSLQRPGSSERSSEAGTVGPVLGADLRTRYARVWLRDGTDPSGGQRSILKVVVDL